MNRLKRYNEYNESIAYEVKADEDGDNETVYAFINGEKIGHVHIEYVMMGGYDYDFESVMSDDEYDELFPDDKYAKINEIKVYSDYRGQGYARKLMKKALERIKERGENRVYLNANPTDGYRGLDLHSLVNFYESFGFKIIVDDYDENKEMLLKLESYKGPNQTWKTMDVYLKMHGDEAKKRRDERIYKEEEEEEEDIVVNDFDEDTPDEVDRPETQEPSMRKDVSLGYGSTNMP